MQKIKKYKIMEIASGFINLNRPQGLIDNNPPQIEIKKGPSPVLTEFKGVPPRVTPKYNLRPIDGLGDSPGGESAGETK